MNKNKKSLKGRVLARNVGTQVMYLFSFLLPQVFQPGCCRSKLLRSTKGCRKKQPTKGLLPFAQGIGKVQSSKTEGFRQFLCYSSQMSPGGKKNKTKRWLHPYLCWRRPHESLYFHSGDYNVVPQAPSFTTSSAPTHVYVRKG